MTGTHHPPARGRRLAPACVLFFAATAFGSGSETSPRARAAADFASLAHDVVYANLAFSPSGATQAGLHRWIDPATGHEVLLDSLLDDLSATGIATQRRFYLDARRRLAAIPRSPLDAETQADYDLVSDGIDGSLFSIDEERFNTRRPELYPELLGAALFANMTLEYADTAARAAHLTARVAAVPAFLRDARRTLVATNPTYTKVAIEEVDGVAPLVTGQGRDFVKRTPLEERYARVAPLAIAAIGEFKAFVRDTLPKRGAYDWRVGPDLYAKKWRYVLQTSTTPDEIMRIARDSVAAARREMFALAKPLHDRYFPSHHHTGDRDSVLNAVVNETMQRIGDEHPARTALFDAARSDVLVLEKEVAAKQILSLAAPSNLRIISTPGFARGIYGEAGAVFAPVLEPTLATFYWVTPIPDDWSAAAALSRLREDNTYKMLDLSMHEGIPGHIVQGAYANLVTPDWRRVLRSVWGNGATVEGWAVYAEHVMMYDAGVNGGDAVKMRLTDLKGMLRVYTNAIIDIGLHARGMPEDSVITMLMRDAFQERAAADGKLQRAKLDYVQLEFYLVGVTEWQRFRDDVQRRDGKAFNECRFHDTVLEYGALPVPVIRRLYEAGVRPSAKAPPPKCG